MGPEEGEGRGDQYSKKKENFITFLQVREKSLLEKEERSSSAGGKFLQKKKGGEEKSGKEVLLFGKEKGELEPQG